MKGYHDMGGEPAGPIDTANHELALWEKRVEAMLALLRTKGIQVTDESRRALESLGANVYLNSTYAEKRIMAAANNLILKGVITVEELAHKLAEVEKRKDQLP
jgi:nitrile hydratase subunit beta